MYGGKRDLVKVEEVSDMTDTKREKFEYEKNILEYEGDKFRRGSGEKVFGERDKGLAKKAFATKKRLAWDQEQYDYVVPEDVRLELLLEKVHPNSSCWMSYYISSCVFIHLYYSRLVRVSELFTSMCL